MNKYVIALYIRLSVDDKKSESLSIDNQKKLLQERVSNMVEDENVEVLEFIDNGYSGTNFERPAVQELLELVQARKINCIIVKDFSRFGRNILEVGYFTEKIFPLFNIRFISISDNFDSANNKSDTGGIGVAFKYLVNEHYSRDLSRKVKSSVYSKMKSGEFKVSQCVFGYKKDKNGKLIIDEAAANTVKLIYELVFEVNRITDLVIILNERGILTPSQYKKMKNINLHSNAKDVQFWSVQAVNKILKNEMYTGVFIGRKFKTKEVGGTCVPNYNKDEYIRVENNHPKIIDEETFKEVQKIVVTGKTNPAKKNEYSLRSKVKCGVCNHAMARVNKVKSFKCKYTLNIEGYSCTGLKILESELEDIILTIVKKQAEIVYGINGKDVDDIDISLSEVNECNNKIKDMEIEKIKCYEEFVRSEISIEKYKSNKEVLDKEIEKLHNILNRDTLQNEFKNEKSNIKELLENIFKENKLSKKIVDALIDKILVYPNKKIEVLWKVN